MRQAGSVRIGYPLLSVCPLPMNLLFVTPMHSAVHVGGLGESCARISSALVRRGHAVTVAVFDSEDEQPRARQDREDRMADVEGVRLHYVPPSRQEPAVPPRPYDLQDVAARLRVLVSASKPDVLVAFYPVPLALPASVVAQRCGVPLVLAFRGSDIGRGAYEPSALVVLQETFRTAAACAFPASDLRDIAAAVTPRLPRSHVIHNGIPDDVLQRAWSRRDGEPTFGSVGVFKPSKRIEIFLRAVETLGFESRAMLIGDFAKSTSRREQFRTRMSGFVPRSEALERLDALDVFVAPSISEGCPNAVLEAMAAGKAIVCTPVGAMADLLQHDVSAWMLDDWSDAAMCDALRAVDADRRLRRRLGEAARTIARNLTVDREAAEWDVFLRGVR